MAQSLEPIHPGEILLEEFMTPLGISQNKMSRDLDVPVARINDIVHGRRAISVDTALRLATYFGTSAEFWISLETRFEVKIARNAQGAEIERTVRPFRAA